MAKIIQDHENCIGCGACESVCPKFWKLDIDAGKAVPVGGKKTGDGKYELEVEEGDVACNQEAADVCPVRVIEILR